MEQRERTRDERSGERLKRQRHRKISWFIPIPNIPDAFSISRTPPEWELCVCKFEYKPHWNIGRT